jgi:hypothetical protein
MKKMFPIFLLTALLFGFFVSRAVASQELDTQKIPLNKYEIESLLDIIRKTPLNISQEELFNNAIKYINQAKYAKQAGAVLLIKQVLLGRQLNFWFWQTPKDFSWELVKLLASLAPAIAEGRPTSALLNIFERLTVQEAKKAAMDWFQQNEVKINVGEAMLTLDSYKNKLQKPAFQYIVMLMPAAPPKAKIIAEFYSKDQIEPPELRGNSAGCPGSISDDPRSACWPFDIWLDQEMTLGNKDGLLEPFILRVKGSVTKTTMGQFVWDISQGQPVVEIEFDKPVPQIAQSDIILSNYEKELQKSWLEKNILGPLQSGWQSISNTGENIINLLSNAFKVLQKSIASLINKLLSIFWQPHLEPANLRLSTNPSLVYNFWGQANQLVGQLQGLLPKLDNLQDNLTKLDPNSLPKEAVSQIANWSQASLNKIIEQFDDLSDAADNLFGQAQTLLTANIGSSSGLNPASNYNNYSSPQGQNPAPVMPSDTTAAINPANSTSSPTASIIFCSTSNITGSPPQDSLIFNEIAWMGTTQSASDEWLELKNILPYSLDIAGWQIINENQNIKIVLPTSTLPNNGLYLLERSNDDSVPNIKADLIYTGALANTNEALYLFDSHCNLQDRIYATPSWPAGDNSSKRTLERKNVYQWQTSFAPFGTPKMPNSDGYYLAPSSLGTAGNPSVSNQGSSSNTSPSPSNPTSTSTPTATSTATTTSTSTNSTSSVPISPTGLGFVVISEAQIQNNEFIELYNSSSSAIDMSSWYLAYFTSTRDWNNPYRNKPFSEAAATVIPANSYYLIGFQGFPTAPTSSNPSSDWQPYSSSQLSNTDGAVGIFSCNPDIATSSTTTQEQASSQAQACKIDAAAWGQTIVYETTPTIPAGVDQSLTRISTSSNATSSLQYQDTNNNLADFVIASSSPTNSLGQTNNSTSSSQATSTVTSTVATTSQETPLPITNLQASPAASREAITLFWTAASSTTPTSSQQATTSQYLIRYSNKFITETATNSSQTSWQDATIVDTSGLSLPATTGQIQILNVFNLSANQKYYFASKWIDNNGATSTISNVAWATPRASFQYNSASSTLTDLLTGLIWVQDGLDLTFNNGTSTSKELADLTIINVNAGAGFGGYNGWRLPNLAELSQLLDLNKLSPLINNNFSNIQPGCYWTSTGKNILSGGQIVYMTWSINMATGMAEQNSPIANCYFLPVRDTSQSQICSSTAQTNPDFTQADPCLKLEWKSRNLHSSSLSWQQAMLNAFAIQDPATSSNWRLPQAQELMRVQDTCDHLHWSLTEDYTNPLDFVWATDLNRANGVYLSSEGKNTSNYSWQVRDTE